MMMQRDRFITWQGLLPLMVTAAMAVCALTVPALAVPSVSAADDTPTEEAQATKKATPDAVEELNKSSKLRDLDLYLAQSLARPGNLMTGSIPATKLGDIGLTMRGGAAKDDSQFLILDDSRPATARFSAPQTGGLLDSSGFLRGLDNRALYNTGGQYGFSIGSEIKEDGTLDRGFEVLVQSSFQETRDSLQISPETAILLTNQLVDREYDLGLQVGYSGFNIDAHLIRRDALFTDPEQGLEAGFSYQGDSFSARLSASEFRRGLDLTSLESGAQRLISFELEASYRLTSRLGLTGGFRYSDFSDRWLLRGKMADDTQTFFIGGRFSF